MIRKLLCAPFLLAFSAILALAGQASAQALDKVTVAGWGPAISEITNLLA